MGNGGVRRAGTASKPEFWKSVAIAQYSLSSLSSDCVVSCWRVNAAVPMLTTREATKSQEQNAHGTAVDWPVGSVEPNNREFQPFFIRRSPTDDRRRIAENLAGNGDALHTLPQAEMARGSGPNGAGAGCLRCSRCDPATLDPETAIG